MKRAADFIRAECRPAFVRVDTYRLAAHSKCDDDRDPEVIAGYARRDPVNPFVSALDSAADAALASIRERVQRAIERGAEPPLTLPSSPFPARYAGEIGSLGAGNAARGDQPRALRLDGR